MTTEFCCSIGGPIRELLSALTLRVRVFSVPQIARTWPSAVSALNRLERECLIYTFTAIVHPELELTAPVTRWSKGENPPDFAAAAYALRKRWCKPALPVKCVIASRAAGQMFGGHGGRYPRESEETHDIHLAAVYLRLRSQFPQLASSWIHEEEIKKERRRKKGRIPDALVGKNQVVEFGGAYKKPKLIAFHKYCEAQEFDYEVW